MNPVPAGVAPATLRNRDPVCGMKVNPVKAGHIRQHAEKNFYFCCQSCADKFDADPHGYLDKPGRRPWFNLVAMQTQQPRKAEAHV